MASLKDFLEEWHSPDDYIVAHTSGSTGQPKEIHLLKEDMRCSAKATNKFFGINSTSVLGIPLSMDYIAGKMMAVRAIEASCQLIELPVANQFEINEHIDLLSVVPSQAACLLKCPTYINNVGAMLLGGASVDKCLETDIINANIPAWIGYGMTETCSHVALRHISQGNSTYHAMQEVTFSTDDRSCLVIESEVFSWKRLATNDVVNLIDSKSFEWVGRADNVINSGGIKVYPEQIEAYIKENTNLPPFYITSAPSTKWGNIVAIVIQGPQCLQHEIERLLNNLEWRRGTKPVVIKMIDELPRTSNGKIRRLTISQIC